MILWFFGSKLFSSDSQWAKMLFFIPPLVIISFFLTPIVLFIDIKIKNKHGIVSNSIFLLFLILIIFYFIFWFTVPEYKYKL